MYAGNDWTDGFGGDDRIVMGPGEDWAIGGGGDDTILLGRGHDVGSGGAGFDDIEGGDGIDEISGGDRDDRIKAGPGDDKVRGNYGDDFIDMGPSGLAVDDSGADAWGSYGNDSFIGGAQSEEIWGGPGFDFMKDKGTCCPGGLAPGDNDDFFAGSGRDWADFKEGVVPGDRDGRLDTRDQFAGDKGDDSCPRYDFGNPEPLVIGEGGGIRSDYVVMGDDEPPGDLGGASNCHWGVTGGEGDPP